MSLGKISDKFSIPASFGGGASGFAIWRWTEAAQAAQTVGQLILLLLSIVSVGLGIIIALPKATRTIKAIARIGRRKRT